MENIIYKRGDINPITNKIFSHYRATGKAQWYSIEAWERRKQEQKKYIGTDKSKEYQKQWYLDNREKRLIQCKENKIKYIEEFPLKALLSSIKSGAKKRKLNFNIDYEFISELWIKQEGKCYYSNVTMKLSAYDKNPYQVSIDRIDSSLGYLKDNTVLCCQAINYMKNDYTLEIFEKFIKSFKDTLKLIP